MKKIKLFIALTTIATASLLMTTSCENNSKEVLYSCDTLSVTYNLTIKPLLNNSCNNPGCHNSSDKASGVILDDYSSIMNLVDTSNLTDTSSTLANSRLFTVVDQNVMPTKKTGSSLSICDKVKIKKWILLGAQNN